MFTTPRNRVTPNKALDAHMNHDHRIKAGVLIGVLWVIFGVVAWYFLRDPGEYICMTDEIAFGCSTNTASLVGIGAAVTFAVSLLIWRHFEPF
jgi:hypothetical protein